MLTPSTVIRFLRTPFSPSQNNLLKFGSISDQETYMLSKVVFTIGGCTYQREGNGECVKVNRNMDTLYNCNYVMFQNANFGSKWFYAFITHMEYVNPQVTKVFLQMDSYQSFQFDFTIAKSFIERQTFSTDYYNTLSDTPSTGDLTTVFEYEKTLQGAYIVLFNADPTMDDPSASTAMYPIIGDFTMPCYMAVFNTPSEMSEVVQAISNKGRADRIQACYYTPWLGRVGVELNLLAKGDLNISNTYIQLIHIMDITKTYENVTVDISYTPTFKKEIAYPYAKLEIVDRITGKYIELDLSKFIIPLSPQFKIIYTFTDRPEYKIIPLNYNGIPYSIENALVINPSSELPIFSNSYAKYLKDNRGANIINGVMSVAGAVGSVMTGNIAGGVSAFANIANIVNADSVARKQPNQCSGLSGDGIDYVNFSPSIYFRLKVMDSDHMDIARNFWNCFGYPVRKITNYSNTSDKFNFVKMVEANLTASTIPTEYLKDLEDIFNKGVTIWNRDYLNYDVT